MGFLGDAYKFLFYKLYRWNYNRADEYPALTALCYVAILITLNFTTVLILLEKLFSLTVFDAILPDRFWKIVFTICIFAVNYFLLYYKGKDKKVIAEQEVLNKNRKKGADIIIIVYIVITPIIFVLSFLCPSIL